MGMTEGRQIDDHIMGIYRLYYQKIEKNFETQSGIQINFRNRQKMCPPFEQAPFPVPNLASAKIHTFLRFLTSNRHPPSSGGFTVARCDIL
jgi:hypothetical protein